MRRSLLTQLGILLTVILLGLGLVGQYLLYHAAEPAGQESASSAPSLTPEARIARIGALVMRDKLSAIEEEAVMLVLQDQWKQLGFEEVEKKEEEGASSSSKASMEPSSSEKSTEEAASAAPSSAPSSVPPIEEAKSSTTGSLQSASAESAQEPANGD